MLSVEQMESYAPWGFERTLFVTVAAIHGINAAFRVAAVVEEGEAEVFEVVLEVVVFLFLSVWVEVF